MKKFSEHALNILENNYYARDSEGNLIEKTPEELMQRLASNIFPDDEELALQLYEALMAQEVIFNSPVMFNLGLPTKQILAACWVGDIEDSMESILEAAKVTGMVFKYGSGMGLPMTNLRPKNDIVSNSGYASGPVSFMHLFDSYGEVIKSGGKRRAAFMSMNDIHHPDVEAIILAKQSATGDLGEQPLENMNISISATDEFMEAVKNSDKYELRFNGKVYRKEDANKIFTLIAESAWKSGDPGLFFVDTVNKLNPLPSFAKIQSTNPCGEQPLHPWTCCNLGHINLTALTYKDNHGNYHLNFERLVELAKLMVYALDRIIDVMDFPSEQFRINTYKTRPVGLGFTGYAEALYRLKIPYSKSQKFIRDLTHLLTSSAIEASIQLAIDLGIPEAIRRDVEHMADLVLYYTGDVDLYEAVKTHGIRNSTWTTLAPTGTTSLAVDAKSYGIEPHFGLVYTKNFVDQNSNNVAQTKTYLNDTFLEAINHLDIDHDKLIKDILANKGSCQNISYLPADIRRVFEVAHDLTPDQHLQICAAAQRYISSAISKTINLPNTATVQNVKEVYFSAWEYGLKGVTIYRDRCKEFQPISFDDSTKKTIKHFKKLPRGVSIERGDSSLGGEIDAWRTACTKMYVVPGYSKDYENVLIETFLTKKTGGGCDSNLKAIALLVSLALRKGIQVKDIEDELFSITCTHCVSARAQGKNINAMSCPQAIAKTLRKQKDLATNYAYLEQELTGIKPVKIDMSKNAPPMDVAEDKCPKCGEPMIIVTGCVTCPACGWGGCDYGR